MIKLIKLMVIKSKDHQMEFIVLRDNNYKLYFLFI